MYYKKNLQIKALTPQNAIQSVLRSSGGKWWNRHVCWKLRNSSQIGNAQWRNLNTFFPFHTYINENYTRSQLQNILPPLPPKKLIMIIQTDQADIMLGKYMAHIHPFMGPGPCTMQCMCCTSKFVLPPIRIVNITITNSTTKLCNLIQKPEIRMFIELFNQLFKWKKY